MANNRIRVLSQVLSLDAWHEPFQTSGGSSAVFVEVSFSEGRIGGDSLDLPFTFKINLKRALLTVRLESPLQIDRSTIARSVPEAQAELTRIRVAKDLAEASLVGKAKLSPASLVVALNGEAKAHASVTQEDQLKLVQAIPETMVTPRPEGSSAYTWHLEPSYRPFLRGQPWDPVISPRLRVKNPSKALKIDPAISVQLSCALEDLDISDIEPKEKGLNGALRNILHNDISEAAAVQHLKLMLRDADLEAGLMDNRFSNLLIASVLAIEQ